MKLEVSTKTTKLFAYVVKNHSQIDSFYFHFFHYFGKSDNFLRSFNPNETSNQFQALCQTLSFLENLNLPNYPLADFWYIAVELTTLVPNVKQFQKEFQFLLEPYCAQKLFRIETLFVDVNICAYIFLNFTYIQVIPIFKRFLKQVSYRKVSAKFADDLLRTQRRVDACVIYRSGPFFVACFPGLRA